MSTAEAKAQAWYEANAARCPRSAEWKCGALAGCRKAHGLAYAQSPWASGTVQDDARNAGYEAAYMHAKHDLQKEKEAAL